MIKLPDNYRMAKPSDIVPGAFIWYDECAYHDVLRKLVDEVLNPSDMWKAYCASDGCRYGLDGAFVEI